MSGKKLTNIQRISRKVGKTVKSCIIQCAEGFKYENFRVPNTEEKIWIYTDACRLAMAELSQDEQMFLIDFYFVCGNKPFKEGVDRIVQANLGKVAASVKCPQTTDASITYIKVGNIYYHQSFVELKDIVLRCTQKQVALYMSELTDNVKNKKDRLINIKNEYFEMHTSSESERIDLCEADENAESGVVPHIISYKDFDELSRSLIRDVVLFELSNQCNNQSSSNNENECED